jgi:hypothetical protein
MSHPEPISQYGHNATCLLHPVLRGLSAILAILRLSTSNCHQLLGQIFFRGLFPQIPGVWKYRNFFSLFATSRLIQPWLGKVPPLSSSSFSIYESQLLRGLQL